MMARRKLEMTGASGFLLSLLIAKFFTKRIQIGSKFRLNIGKHFTVAEVVYGVCPLMRGFIRGKRRFLGAGLVEMGFGCKGIRFLPARTIEPSLFKGGQGGDGFLLDVQRRFPASTHPHPNLPLEREGVFWFSIAVYLVS
jgi:hypothetical protein